MDSPSIPPRDAREEVGRKLLKNSLANVLTFLVSVPVMIVLVPVLMTGLGPVGYGVWTLANTLLSFSGLLQLGFGPAMVTYVAEHEAKRDFEKLSRVAASCALAFLAIAGVSTALAVVFEPFVTRRLLGGAGIAVLQVTILVFWLRYPLVGYSLVITGLQRQYLVQAVNLASTVAFAVGAVVILDRGGGVLELLWWSAATAAASQAAFIWIAQRICPELRAGPWRADRASLGQLWTFGWRVSVGAFAASVHDTFDKFILSARLGRTDLAGFYDISTNLLDKALSVSNNTMGPILPASSELQVRSDRSAVGALYVRAQRYNLVLATLLLGGAFVVGGPILNVWLKSVHPFTVAMVHVLAVGFYARALYFPGVMMLYARERPDVVTKALLVGSFANVLASLALGSLLGPVGYAAGTSLALVLESALLLEGFRRSLPLDRDRPLLPDLPWILLAFAVAAAVGTPLAAPATRAHPLPFLVGGVAYAAAYGVALVALGVLGSRDLPVAKKLFGIRG